MERPARAVAVTAWTSQARMIDREFAEKIALQRLQVVEGIDAGDVKAIAPHLKFNPPYLVRPPPQLEEPELLALLFDLGDLVVDTYENIAATAGECLHNAVL